MNAKPPLKLFENSTKFSKNFLGKSWKNVRLQGTAAVHLMEPDYIQAKPFKSIPGPKSLPIPFGNMWNFTFGKYAKVDYNEMHRKLFEEFGPIVRMSGLMPQPYVFLYDPSYVETMFRNDSVWPKREGFDCVKYYLEHVLGKDDYFEHGGMLFK